MAESLTIARPYAEAAFKLAQGPQALAHWSDALARLAAVVASPAAHGLLGNPRIKHEQVAQVVSEVAGDLSADQLGFLRLLAENDRLTVLPEIVGHFERLKNQADDVLDARIDSAYSLTEQQLAQVIATLEGKYGRKVKATVSVDPELIGGISIRIGDEVLDTSVRGKLAQLADALMK
jgi:F-type H+-transporting ATPase subunit delta